MAGRDRLMIDIGKVGSAGGASKYFTRDNYYTDSKTLGPSQWVGKGAELLHLRTPKIPADQRITTAGGENMRGISTKDFETILEGKVYGTQIGDPNNRTPGRDVVFSVSKSVSIMALIAKDERIVELMQKTAKEMVTHIENNYAGTRVKEGGKVRQEKTDNVVAALITHDTSRAQEAHLHIHAVFANMTKDRNGVWRSFDYSKMYENRAAISNLFDAKMAKGLRDMGYKIEMKGYGTPEITGVPKDLIKQQSTRRNEIEEHIEDGASWGTRRVAALDTRDDKKELDRSKLHETWVKGAGDNYKQIMSIKTAAYSQNIQTPRLQKNSLKRVVNNAIYSLTQNSTILTHEKLIEKSLLFAGHRQITTAGLDRHIKTLVRTGSLKVYDNNSTGKTLYTTEALVKAETNIIAEIHKTRNVKPITNDLAGVTRTFKAQGLQAEQLSAAVNLMTSKGMYHIIQGGAGTGKTYSVGKAVETIKQLTPSQKIHGFAPTIPATEQLGKDINQEAITSQRFLAGMTNVLKGYKPNAQQTEKYQNSILVFDESSMIGSTDMNKIMEAGKALGVKKVFFVGDRYQHPSIPAGEPFALMQDNGAKTSTITEIRRQRDNPELLSLSEKLRDHNLGKDTIDQYFKEVADRTYSGKDYTQQAADKYVSLIQTGYKANEIIALSPDNKTRLETSDLIRDGLKAAGRLSSQDYKRDVLAPTYLSDADASYAQSYQTGDKLVFNNDYKNLKLKRGDVFEVKHIDTSANVITIQNNKGRQVNWELRTLENAPFTHMKDAEISLSKGDLVRFQNEDKQYDIQKEQKATITDISDKQIRLKMTDGTTMFLANDARPVKFLAHDYTSTTYKGQGLTKRVSLFVANARSRAVSTISNYIAGTRPTDDYQVFTNDSARLEKQIRQNTGSEGNARDGILAEISDGQIERVPTVKETVKAQTKDNDARTDSLETEITTPTKTDGLTQGSKERAQEQPVKDTSRDFSR